MTSTLSPNQLAKRDHIVAATVDLLLEGGVHACTARSIAGRAEVSNGSIHYYFDSVDEIVDAAMATALSVWLRPIREAAHAGHDSAAEMFWELVERSLAPYLSHDRRVTPMYLDYWSDCMRRSRLEPVRALQDQIDAAFADTLTACGVDEPERRARNVVAHLWGTGIQHVASRPIDGDELREQVAHLAGLDAPGAADQR